MQWAAAGSNVTLYLTAIDPIHLDVGSVLCPLTDPVELASAFTARIIVFDIQVPILAGTSVSERSGDRPSGSGGLLLTTQNIPHTADRALPSFSRRSGGDIKTERHAGPRFWCCHQAEPSVRLRFYDRFAHTPTHFALQRRPPFYSVLTKGTSAEVKITMRQAAFAGPGARSPAIPLEPFSANKEMGRILIRRGGETIAAGKYPIL